MIYEPQNLLNIEWETRHISIANNKRFTYGIEKHVIGKASDGVSYEENENVWGRFRFIPRILRDVENIDIKTSVLGCKWDTPIGIAPIGHIGLIHPNAELELVRGSVGHIYTAATVSTKSLEDIQEENIWEKWFQLYFFKDRYETEEIVKRATKAGYKALVVTVDSPVVGWREQETIPDQIFGNIGKEVAGENIRSFVRNLLSPTVTWEDIEWIHSITAMPIILKGILSQEDAIFATRQPYIRGVWFSNHGGRQLDRVPTAIQALEQFTKTPYGNDISNGSFELYVDGGVRRGADVAIGLILGANAVFIGRPALYALKWKDAEGVRIMLDILRRELINTMTLLGVTSVSELRGKRELLQIPNW